MIRPGVKGNTSPREAIARRATGNAPSGIIPAKAAIVSRPARIGLRDWAEFSGSSLNVDWVIWQTSLPVGGVQQEEPG